MNDIKFQNKKQEEYLKRQIADSDFVGFMLFVGQRGSGKYEAAYNFAKSVLCGETEFCGECPDCKLAKAGNHPDLIQIGGQDTIKIAEVRDLQKTLYLKPYKAEYKVAIIHDAHLMTEESANALLKILEEPPENSVIILTAPDKTLLPETVVSRSQLVNFGANRDGIEVSEEVSEDVIRVLGGGGSLPERFSVAHKYALDKKSASDFLDGLEINMRALLLKQPNPTPGVGLRDVSESNIIKSLELVQKSRGYLKSNLAVKFVLENIIINL